MRDEAAADDLAQDVLDAASSRPPALEGRRLRGWLSTVARRRAARVRTRAEARLRAEHARSRDEAVDPGPERDDALDRVVLHRELARVIADLGAAERTAIVEHYLEGRSFAEIAARSGVSEAAQRKSVQRRSALSSPRYPTCPACNRSFASVNFLRRHQLKCKRRSSFAPVRSVF